MSLVLTTLLQASKQIGPWKVIFIAIAAPSLGGALYLAAQGDVGTVEAMAGNHAESLRVIGATRHDFGRVTSGTSLQHDFMVKNCGATRIVLLPDLGGCCGDDSPADYIILAPGDQLPIPLMLDTLQRNGSARRTMTLTTSDPKRPKIEFRLTAYIVDANDRTGCSSANGD